MHIGTIAPINWMSTIDY